MKRAPKPVPQFVQVARQPSLGVELTAGTAWIGVDQQVGHGSADALFALTAQQYVDALRGVGDAFRFASECWHGQHDDLRLFSPAGGAWTPQRWAPVRARMLEPRVKGEIWHHIDALADVDDGPRLALSRALGAEPHRQVDGHLQLRLRLSGPAAYPRPAAVIAGLDAGSSRAEMDAVLGATVDGDAYAIERNLLRPVFNDDGLVALTLEPRPAEASRTGALRWLVDAIGGDEAGPAFEEVAQSAGRLTARWASSSGAGRRILEFDDGVTMQTQDARVVSIQIPFASTRFAQWLLPDIAFPPTRGELVGVLGPAFDHDRTNDLHVAGDVDLIVSDAGTPDAALTAIRRETNVSHRALRWRSGEFTLFLDLLGLPVTHPLVAHVKALNGTRVTDQRGIVTAVTIGANGYESERFAAFVDGMPADPTRTELRLSAPAYTGDHDDLRDCDQGWIHVHAADGTHITRITVSSDSPRGLDVHPWRWSTA